MLGFTGKQIKGVGEERKHGAEGAFGAAWATGQIEDQGASYDATYATAEGGVGGVVGAVLADEFSEAGDEALANGEGSLGRDIAGGETRAPGGDDQGGVAGCGAQGGGKDGQFVREDERLEDARARGGEDLGDGRAGEIGLGPGGAAVTDSDDDGGAAGEGGEGWHVSRIDAAARNVAEDEKMKGQRLLSGDSPRRRNSGRGQSVTD